MTLGLRAVASRLTVGKLAAEADTDVEDVLVTLWDLGLDEVDGPDDYIPRQWLKRARRALGVYTPRQQKSVDFWLTYTGLTRDALTQELLDLGVTLSPNVRRLPKGALSKLRRRFLVGASKVAQGASHESTAPCPDHEWQNIGQLRSDLSYIDETEVRYIHESLARDFAKADDPIEPPGIKSESLLSSAVARPLTSLGGELKYPTAEMAGAALLHSLVLNHPFHNGNKRTGIVALLVFLDKNGIVALCEERDLFKFVLRVAQHSLAPMHCPDLADRESLAMAGWIRANSRRIEKGERPIPWHRLRRILRSFDCEIEVSSGVGNRINITRTVTRRGLVGRRSAVRQLSTQVAYGDEGRTVERNTLNKLRHDLGLDEGRGVDSKAFYEADAVPDDFIQQYRTLLRRLARV